MMTQIDPKFFIGKAKISYQYADYSENEWTAPIDLTEERLQKVYDDLSVTKLRIYPKGERKFYELDIQ